MASIYRLTHNALFTFILLATLGCAHSGPEPVENKWTASTHPLDFSSAQRFTFHTSSPEAEDVFPVNADTTYNDARGYGFDLDTAIDNTESSFYFSVRVPQGNYRVTLELGHPKLTSTSTVKAESRRLYLHNLTTAPGEMIHRDFIVNVRNASLIPPEHNAPGGTRVLLKSHEQHRLHWDDKLTLEFNGGTPPRSITVQKINVPTVYLVGDSTVTDQPYEPTASWGQMLPVFFDSTLAVANHAESGETLKSFMSSLRFAKVLESIKPGDYLFIQFGHNDQKMQWPQTYVEAETTYQDYLTIFIAEARLRGATPVLVTSMQRRTFNNNGKILNTHGSYPEAMRKVAHEQQVALIDLESMSVKLYEALGVQNAPLAFNDNGKDATHHNNYGAYQLAKCVLEGIRHAKLPLASHILTQVPGYDPTTPDSPAEFVLNPSPRATSERPAGN